MGMMALVALLMVEAFFLIWRLASKNRHTEENSVVRIAELFILGILLITDVFQWGFQYFAILAVLIIQAVWGLPALLRKRDKPYSAGGSVLAFFRAGLLYALALSLAILCPQYVEPEVTGTHRIATSSLVWTDESRQETFSNGGEPRAVNVDFWYPEEAGKYPLVLFSHGAFGFSGSNISTFIDLASNGYVVASIGHPYHAFYAQGADGKPILADLAFINSVYAVNNMEDGEEKQAEIKKWKDLRVADEHFVLNTITVAVQSETGDDLFSRIDLDKIGAIGHSLGGASFAQLGRERQDIDAVVDLDGTMLGEFLGYRDGEPVLNHVPYPVPLLNIYAEDHYLNALPYGERYENFHASSLAVSSYEVILKDAGHLNLTDLPLFSPILARMLGVGTVDARYAIETTNAVVLEFFNYALKDGPAPQFEKEYGL